MNGRPDARGMGTIPEHPACAVRSGSPAGGLGIICDRGPYSMGLGLGRFMLRRDTFVEALRRFLAKLIAAKLKASPRTVEAWKQGKAAPHARHTVAMLNDEELCARLLEAAGRSDLANAQETIAALRKALGKVEGQ